MVDYIYDFEIKDEPGIRTDVYVAKIVGEHPDYIYRREFVIVNQHATADGHRYEPELDDYGVYECSVKSFEDRPGGRFLGRSRQWFLLFDCAPYEIPEQTVMDTWRWLSKFLAEGGAAIA